MSAVVVRYENWTEFTARRLREVFIGGPVVERLRAERYWLIVGGRTIEASRTASMMHTELDELRAFFMQVANELRVLKDKYSLASWLVLDTNDLLHYYRFDNIPWTSLYGKGVRVAIPHVVLDEIDAKSYNAGRTIQRRARGVYRLLETLLTDVATKGHATLKDGTFFDVLTDERGHVRLPNNDDEIVARAAFLQQAAYPGRVMVITRDIGMRARALGQGLKVAKIPDKYLIREDGLSTSNLNDALTEISPAETSLSS
jgi:rRNA-processing protein FCF1